MHPQIRQDKPGKCPICAMDLIPVRKGSGGGENSDPKAIQLSEEAAALADVQTSKVSRENPVKTVRLYGKIAPNEQSLQSQTAHVGGRIEQLNINFTGESVRAGQTLAVLYSPELFTAQRARIRARFPQVDARRRFFEHLLAGPLPRLLRLSLFQFTVGMAVVLLIGTLNRVMIVELAVPASLVAVFVAAQGVLAYLLLDEQEDRIADEMVLARGRVADLW